MPLAPTRHDPAPALAAAAASTPPNRNRSVDAYRALAMAAVAGGHWLAADVRIAVDGGVVGANALDHAQSLHILTWVFQVMPLFFCIGGYANAASLDAHARNGGTPASWVMARLRRLSAPSVWLAGTWLTVAVVGPLVGVSRSLVSTAVGVAAIPLWFLGNYVADTALAPWTLRCHRRYGLRFAGVLAATFLCLEATRFTQVPYAAQANIVVGWLCFQLLGFAWKDARLPAGRALVAIGVACWSAAAALIAFGPWPLAMVSVPGARFANTWPPSLALLGYGMGACSFAIAASPGVNRYLVSHTRSWKAVVVANTMAMTSYLWHFTALAVSALVCAEVGLLPTAPVASRAWWAQKLPVMGVALAVLAGVITLLAGKERAGLLTAPDGAVTSPVTAAALALVLAAGFETWTAAAGRLPFAVAGMVLVLLVHRRLTRGNGAKPASADSARGWSVRRAALSGAERTRSSVS